MVEAPVMSWTMKHKLTAKSYTTRFELCRDSDRDPLEVATTWEPFLYTLNSGELYADKDRENNFK